MQAPIVFFSWQSDTEEKWNRYFILPCLEQAAANAANELGLKNGIVIHRDTSGVGGSPSIPETIFGRIDNCAVFVGDITLVGQAWPYDKEQKPETTQMFPNANVILELGYAVKTIGWKRVLGVMNSAKGKPDKQIFHLLQHRWPLQYELAEKAQAAEAGKLLIKKLTEYVREALKELHADATRILQRMNIECLQLLRFLKGVEYFSYENMKQAGDENAIKHFESIFTNATNRLLDLGVIYTKHDASKGTYAFHWTYVGGLLKERV